MDYSTGIVGTEKRRISLRCMQEAMYVKPKRGIPKNKTGTPHESRIRRSLENLKKLGVIEQIDHSIYLIFKLPLAISDKSVRKIPDGNSTPLTDAKSDVRKMPKNPGVSRDSVVNDRQPDAYPDTPKIAYPDTPPVSVIKNKSLKAYVHSRFDEFWKIYPRKENKKKAHAIWERRQLDLKADLIINDVILRMEKHEPWKDKQYIPHATTYLNGERWEDEIRECEDRRYQSSNKQNSVTVAIANILRSREKAH